MKTTIEISDSLLSQARRIATRENTTLRALVETGLRQVLEAHQVEQQFELRDASYKGKGLQPEFQGADWAQIRAATYEDCAE